MRAAATSACRAGYRPIGIDLFGDRDLCAIAQARRVAGEGYPEALATIAEDFPPGPWIYTGALENAPHVIDRIAGDRPLWGIGGEALRRVRDPFAVADALRSAGIDCPRVAGHPRDCGDDRPWLVKPIRSAGGRGIRRLDRDRTAALPDHYIQEQITGTTGAALFVAHAGGVRPVGATVQLLVPGQFRYWGSIGPWALPEGVTARLARIGHVLAGQFGLRGLFGVDFVLRGAIPFPVEVNPRYTASAEILELATGIPLLTGGAETSAPGRPTRRNPPMGGIVGKAILSARRAFAFPALDRWRSGDPWRVPAMADIPGPGEPIASGQPIMTVFARGATLGECRDRLERRLRRWDARLQGDEVGDEVVELPLG